VAAVAGAVGLALVLSADDRSVAVGIPAGALAGAFAALLSGMVVSGARGRARAGSGAIVGIPIAAAAALAALSLLFGPVSLIALAGLVALAAGRRRRAARKYEGLRVLR
jgi:hypothetical protein